MFIDGIGIMGIIGTGVSLGWIIKDAIKTAIYWFFLTIDGLALDLARTAYKVFYFTSKITLISGDQIERFTNRVYLILGIALVFIIAYNLLTYIIDPDKMSDKKSGAGAFIKNVIVSLVIVVITPMAFVKLYSFQNIIIEQGIIGNIILGTAAPEEGPEECRTLEDDEQSIIRQKACSEAILERGANNAVASVFTAFVIPTSGDYSAADCGNNDYDPDSDEGQYCSAYALLLNEGTISNVNGTEGMKELILDEVTEDEPRYTYYIIFCTAGIVVMILFFLSYCIELGKRAGKLAILQLLAPIPVLMEIVPGKSGSRQKWLNMTLSTYLDVFVYQATIFLVIFLITFVPGAIGNLFDIYKGGDYVILKSFAVVFVIFGLLKFGKDVPKMIEDLLGIKSSSGGIFKNLGLALGGAGLAAGLVGSTVGRGVRNAIATDGNGWKKAKSALAGSVSGVARTLYGAKDVNSIKDAKKLRKQINEQLVTKKVQRSAYAHSHPGKFGSTVGHIQDTWENVTAKGRSYIGVQNDFERQAEQEKVLSEMKGIYNAEIKDAIYKKDGTWNQLESMLNQAKANGKVYEYKDNTGRTHRAYDSKGWYIDASGKATSGSDLDRRQKKLEQDLRKKNTDKVSRALGRMQNLANPHQGIVGISNIYHKIDDLFPGGTYDDARWNDFIDEFENGQVHDPITHAVTGTLPGGGYKGGLDTLKNNASYQQKKVEKDIALDAKQQVEKAAKEKSAEKK